MTDDARFLCVPLRPLRLFFSHPPKLSSRSGVPVATLSRLECTGLASTNRVARILFALDAFQNFPAARPRRATSRPSPTNPSSTPLTERPKEPSPSPPLPAPSSAQPQRNALRSYHYAARARDGGRRPPSGAPASSPEPPRPASRGGSFCTSRPSPTELFRTIVSSFPSPHPIALRIPLPSICDA